VIVGTTILIEAGVPAADQAWWLVTIGVVLTLGGGAATAWLLRRRPPSAADRPDRRVESRRERRP
jgi:hypothetical protein